MRFTRARYHLAIKDLKRKEKILRRERFAESILKSDNRSFWYEVKKLSRTKRTQPSTIDGVSNPDDMCEVFASKYRNLYSSVPSNDKDMSDLRHSITTQIINDQTMCYFSVEDVVKLAKKLNRNKSDGLNGPSSNHFIFAPKQFYVYFSIMLHSMLVHGVNPSVLLRSVIIPIPKNTKASLNDSKNYRGIALSSALTKIIDMLIMEKYRDILMSSDMQYAFKDQHSTVICTNVLKETVGYYNNRGSTVYTRSTGCFCRLRQNPFLYSFQAINATWSACSNCKVATGLLHEADIDCILEWT